MKTAYEMRISDWSSDVCSSDLLSCRGGQFVCTILNMSLGGAKVALSDARDCAGGVTLLGDRFEGLPAVVVWQRGRLVGLQFKGEPATVARALGDLLPARSEEHTSELQSLMRSSYAVFCLKKKHIIKIH